MTRAHGQETTKKFSALLIQISQSCVIRPPLIANTNAAKTTSGV